MLIGDIYQIEAIKFGNWFNFARYFVDKKSVYELVTPYRAKDKSILLDMWTCVRNFDENMFERLLANGFISTLNESIFERDDDEIVLCLGYDGLYGVNNINRYMQKINPSKPIEWGNWTYKVGDKVLFNESRRFGNVLYNNLKGIDIGLAETVSDIEVLSFHKGFKKIMNIWKKVNEGSGNKLGIVRDYDNQPNAKKQHDKYNDDKEICVRTTEYYTLEPEIVNTGDNYKILKNKYGDVFGWNDMTAEQLTEAWKNAKATDMFTICKDLASGELEGFQMPKHIQDVIDFLSQESEEVL